MPTIVDHVQDSIERVPANLEDGEMFDRLVRLLAERWQALDDVTLRVVNAIELQDDSPAWVMDLVGAWLNEPRRGAWHDSEYLYALRAKQRVRRSNGTWPDIYEVARALRPGPPFVPNASTDVDVWGAPKSVVVDIPSLFQPVLQDIAKTMLLRSVGATTQLALTVSTDGLAFTFDEDDKGWDNGLLVELV